MGNNGSNGLSEGGIVDKDIYTRGNQATQTSPREKRSIWIELTALWLGALLLIRLCVFLQKSFGIHEIILGLVPLIFIYVPVWLSNRRNIDSYSYRLFIPAFTDLKSWGKALGLAGILTLAVWGWFVPLYHMYQTEWATQLFAWKPRSYIGTLPDQLILTILFQIFYVAIPEEFFYRGYFQTRLNEAYERKWEFFGTKIGMGAVYANLFFAFGHSIVQFQWWHFATFFPGMLFAWARERSNGVLAGALFHAICNIGIVCLDTMYGIRAP